MADVSSDSETDWEDQVRKLGWRFEQYRTEPVTHPPSKEDYEQNRISWGESTGTEVADLYI
jgi:hypothetical protein